MKTLLEDLLHVMRTDTAQAELRTVAASTLVEAALNNLRAAIEESGATVTTGPLPVVTVNPVLLTQVLQNLISNAIKFRVPGTRPVVHVGAHERGGAWVFAVRDNGIGIQPQHTARIFQVFERLHPAGESPGSGVGLVIGQRIVEPHGGTLCAPSPPAPMV